MIGWYVHHHGRGHLTRARCVVEALDERVTGLSTLPSPGAPFAAWVRLPPDDTASEPGDASANGALHWAPLRDRTAAARVAALARWIADHRPRAVVVDVSVEAALVCRLAGVPVVVVAQPGERTDAVHTLGYHLADAIVAPWSAEVYAPSWLAPWAAKTTYVGAFSRFDDRRTARPRPGVVAVLGGGGGSWTDVDGGPTSQPAVPGWTWEVVDDTTDTWTTLDRAGVVVCHAGLNALAEVAAARRPAVVIPQDRPFGEQAVTARALHDAAIVRSEPAWPPAARWSTLLAEAATVDPAGWSRWSTGDGAARTAEVVRRVAEAGPSW